MKNRTKILIYTDAFSGGGAEEVMNIYAQELRNQYAILHVAKWLGPRRQKLPYWKINLKRNSLKAATFQIVYILVNFKPNLVITSTAHNNLFFLFFKLLSFGRFKVIIRESSVASVMIEHANLKGKVLNKLVKTLYPFADKIITQSDDMTNDLVAEYNLSHSKLVKLNNPIVFTAINQSITNIEEEINLLTIGRLSKEKGFDRLLKIVSKLPKNFKLRIMGEGEMEIHLHSEVARLGLGEQVLFLGFLNGEEKGNEIMKTDIYIQTSYVEGFPNSLLECVYNGIPAIAFKVKGGTKEIITPINGVLVNDGDIDGMVREILEFKKSNYDVSSMTKDVEHRFSKMRIMNKLNQVIEEVIS